MTPAHDHQAEIEFREGLASSLASIDGRLKLLDQKVETVNTLARIRHRDVESLAATVKLHEIKLQQASGAVKILAGLYALIAAAVGSLLWGAAKKLGMHLP